MTNHLNEDRMPPVSTRRRPENLPHPDQQQLAAIRKRDAARAGQNPFARAFHQCSRPPELILRASNDLRPVTAAIMERTRQKFTSNNHAPSEEHLAALEQIATAMVMQAHRQLTDGIYLSSLDPGIGKSTVIQCTLLELRARIPNIGALILIEQVRDIESAITELIASGYPKTEIAAIVSDNAAYNMHANVMAASRRDASQARVLFTTQAQIEKRCSNGPCSFASIKSFWFRGKPRAVRAWDEAIAPSSLYTLTNYHLLKMLEEVAANSPAMERGLRHLIKKIEGAPNGSIIHIPDIRAHGFSVEDMKGWFNDMNLVRLCETLYRLSDRHCRVRHEGHKQVVLNYEDMLPPDLGPLVVCDASGRVRTMYEHWWRDRGGLHFLQSPRKDYTGLTIHLADVAAGRDTFKPGTPQAEARVKAIVDKITAEVPSAERALIVHYKPKQKQIIDVAALVNDQLPRRAIGSCTWGKHAATNEFAESQARRYRGCIAGPPMSVNEAQARAAKAWEAQASPSSEAMVKESPAGGNDHDLYQAVCGATCVRVKAQGVRPEIMPMCWLRSMKEKASLPKLWRELFPGATIVPWHALPAKLTGNAAALVHILDRERLLSPDSSVEIRKTALQEELGIASLSNLNKVLNSKQIRSWCGSQGILMHTKGAMVAVAPDARAVLQPNRAFDC